MSTFLAGLSSYFNKEEDSGFVLEPFSIILPVSAVIYDCDLRRVYKRQEKRFFTVVKIIYWVFFFVIFGLAAN